VVTLVSMYRIMLCLSFNHGSQNNFYKYPFTGGLVALPQELQMETDIFSHFKRKCLRHETH
jgi:hypothetical protein